VKKGNRPSWNEASSFQNGEKLYNKFIDLFKKSYTLNKVQVGSFGSDMKINLTNDGPVTIFFDSKNKF
jgi:D-tyrosyl-tRNA(Tyr) deacylase